jgi:hypothetical protein
MIVVIHGITGTDNHSAVVGAVEAESQSVVKLAMRKFCQTHGKAQLNRELFSRFAVDSKLPIVPVTPLDYDQV